LRAAPYSAISGRLIAYRNAVTARASTIRIGFLARDFWGIDVKGWVQFAAVMRSYEVELLSSVANNGESEKAADPKAGGVNRR
jgi:hypothetical protein